jgi:type II secretory pathway component GspD/PulD (secretin)
MKMNHKGRGRGMKFAGGVLGAVVALGLVGPSALGQAAESATAEKAKQDAANSRIDSRPYQTFYLANTTSQNEANEIVVAVRNVVEPSVRIYLVPSENALVMRATPDQLALAQKIINDIDRPKKVYRLTYTITEMDGGKRIGNQHFAMVLTAGQRTVVKQGSKVPIATGSYNEGNSGAQTQFTYLDVGLSFEATLDEYGNGARVRSKVEQSSIAEEKSGVGAQDPIVRQTVMEGTSFLTRGKPMVLGSLDVPGSTRHLDVEVVMEQVAQ